MPARQTSDLRGEPGDVHFFELMGSHLRLFERFSAAPGGARSTTAGAEGQER